MSSLKIRGFILALFVGVSLGNECSQQNRTDNLAGCLQRIKEIMYLPDLFWFGTGYATACPNGPAGGSIQCSNPLPGTGQSVGTRVLSSGYDTSLLTKFLTVKFTSDKGQYTGCGNTVSSETRMFDVDPSSSQIYYPWDVRHTPEMTWNAEDGEHYSLYVYDVGYLITHAVYINIQGNNLPTSGENLIDPYHGPLIAVNRNNPYIFMLFKQNGTLNPTAAMEWYNASHAGMAATSHIPDFISLLNMTGPIAVNWIVARGDAYAAETMYSRGILSTCPVFVGNALDMMPRPFLPNQSELTVMMHVTFDVESLVYTTCCRNYSEPQRTFTLNPIGNELLPTSTARSGMRQTVTMEKMGYYQARNNFAGDMFTLIAFDPDVPSNAGNKTHPLVHQMQINIMENNFTSGEEALSWMGPYPPNNEPHYYYFLLYKHMDPVNRTQMLSYAGDCGTNLAGRCQYDINMAVSENGFMLVGASWFRSERDSYVIYRNIQRDPTSEAAQCEGQLPAGLTVNCETSAGNTRFIFSSLNAILFVIISLYLN